MRNTGTRKPFKPTKGTLAAILLASMMNCMGGAAVAPALPIIGEAFPEASETLISMIITLPSVAIVVAGFFAGAIADRVGKAKTLVVSLILVTITGLSGLVLPTIELILAGRFIMGIGLVGVSTATTALVADYYDVSERPRVLGMQNAATGVSILVMETTGGFLALMGWRVPFSVYVIGIVMLVFAALFVREPDHSSRPTPDSEGASQPVRTEERASRRTIAVICIGGMGLIGIFTFIVPAKLPYLIIAAGGNTAMSGIFIAIFGTANIISALAYARIDRRFTRSQQAIGSLAMEVAGFLTIGLSPSFWGSLPGTILIGMGFGILMPLIIGWLQTITTYRNSGKYMSGLSVANNLGQFSSALIAGAIILQVGSYSTLFIIYAAIPAVLLIGCIVSALRHKKEPER